MVWAIWGLLIGNNVGEHAILVIIYILMIIFLMTEYVKEYFRLALYFTYGPYTLYTRRVELLSGKILDIYFFSIKTPKSGNPSPMPEGYEVGVNERNGLPYLKKKGKKPKQKEVKPTVEKEITKKSSNVIYVVSKPQPGQVKGDWAVRSRGKIFSHHRKQENAIKAAKKIAKEKDATVMIQGTDGKFREGLKPKK
jgi:hypothetical protein